MNNYPDNWSSFWERCAECGRRYHASGTVECACEKCDVCSEWFAPNKLDDGVCAKCREIAEEAALDEVAS